MSLKRIEIVYDVEASQLDAATAAIKEQARQLGLVESEVSDLNNEYKKQVTRISNVNKEQSKQVTSLKQLKKEASDLAKALDNATDPEDIDRLNLELKEARTRIKDARLEADRLSTELDDVGDGGRLSGLRSGLSDIASIATGGLITGGISSAIEGVVSGLRELAAESIELFDIQATADEQLRVGLESTGNVVGRTVEQLKQQATDLQGITLFGDEQTQGAQSILLTFTNIREEIFDRTVPAVQNLATRLGTDLNSAALQVGKALNDPVAGLSALSRSGIQFSEDQEELIKSFVAAGDAAAAQNIILQELEVQFGGAAEAAARAGAGGITQLENKISDVKEEIGRELIPIQEAATRTQLAFIEAIADTVAAFTDFFGISSELSEQTSENQTEFNALVGALNNTNESLTEVGVSEEVLQSRQEVRNGILTEINSKYGEYLPNLLTEKSSIEEIAAAQEIANGKFRDRIALLVNQEAIASLEQEAAQILRNINLNERRIAELQNQDDLSFIGESNLRRNQEANAELEQQFESITRQLQELASQSLEIDTAGTEQVIEDLTTVVDTIDEVNSTPVRPTTDRALIEGTVAFLQNQIRQLQEELKFQVALDDAESRRTILSQIAAIEQAIKDANDVFTVTGVVDIDQEAIDDITTEIPPIDLSVTTPTINANDILPKDEAEQLQVRIDNALEGLSTLDNFLGTLSFDTSGLEGIADIIRNSISEGLDATDGLGLAGAGINQLGSILDEFSNSRIARKEAERDALIKLEEETGVSQAQAVAEVDAELERIERNRFIRNKAQAAAEAAINTALAITKLLANPILAAVAAAFGAIQIGLILAQPVPFKDGVFSLNDKSQRNIPGPGTGTSDSIPARLSKGESVITAKDTKTYSNFIENIVNRKKSETFKFGNTELIGFDMPLSDRKALESILNVEGKQTNADESILNAMRMQANAQPMLLNAIEVIPITNESGVNAIMVNANAGRMQDLDYERLGNVIADKVNAKQSSAMWKDGHLMKELLNEAIRGNTNTVKLLSDIANASNK